MTLERETSTRRIARQRGISQKSRDSSFHPYAVIDGNSRAQSQQRLCLGFSTVSRGTFEHYTLFMTFLKTGFNVIFRMWLQREAIPTSSRRVYAVVIPL